jgi:putative tricarboxylic transport membrane protein
VDSTVNNPIEAVAQWRGGKLRPLCSFSSQPLAYKKKVTKDMSWGDIPTCKKAGLDVEYQMLRGIFMPGGVSKDQVDYWVALMKKVRELPEWNDFMEQGAFTQEALAGKQYADWVAREEKRHFELMKEAGFLAKP